MAISIDGRLRVRGGAVAFHAGQPNGEPPPQPSRLTATLPASYGETILSYRMGVSNRTASYHPDDQQTVDGGFTLRRAAGSAAYPFRDLVITYTGDPNDEISVTVSTDATSLGHMNYVWIADPYYNEWAGPDPNPVLWQVSEDFDNLAYALGKPADVQDFLRRLELATPTAIGAGASGTTAWRYHDTNLGDPPRNATENEEFTCVWTLLAESTIDPQNDNSFATISGTLKQDNTAFRLSQWLRWETGFGPSFDVKDINPSDYATYAGWDGSIPLWTM